MVLAFSPVGDAFRTRVRKFPALVNCTVIDWFQPWPHEALFSVGTFVLGEGGEGGEQILSTLPFILGFFRIFIHILSLLPTLIFPSHSSNLLLVNTSVSTLLCV